MKLRNNPDSEFFASVKTHFVHFRKTFHVTFLKTWKSPKKLKIITNKKELLESHKIKQYNTLKNSEQIIKLNHNVNLSEKIIAHMHIYKFTCPSLKSKVRTQLRVEKYLKKLM